MTSNASLQKSPDSQGLTSLHGHITGLESGGHGVVFGSRIPYEYFVTKGFGETDSGGGVDPYETGSYDLALEEAGIANFNIVTYSSCMPVESKEISRDASNATFHHGAVCEVIMARMDGQQGDRISAGVARCNVKKKNGGPVSGFAAEYRGHATEEMVKRILYEDVKGIFSRRYDESQFEMEEVKYTINVREVAISFGTVLASVCFTSYIHPILKLH